MPLKLGKWCESRRFFAAREGVTAFSGISGGRTSAMMAALHDPSVVLTFQNTGREHPGTYDFLAQLDEAIQREGRRGIVWLEWRPPAVKGAPPREHRCEVVSYKTAARDGSPFRGFLQALADFRKKYKDKGPVSPWARSRICTAYMKRKVQEHYIASLGVDEYDSFVGLRADEPERVHRLKDRDTNDHVYRCPLSEAGITKQDVNAFWAEQDFNLNIAEHQGNCTACFLKDQSDLSRVLGEPETDLAWWEQIERDFIYFGGRRFPGYTQLASERDERLRIEAELQAGRTPVSSGALEPARYRLVLLQEKRRFAGEKPTFSCSCEQSGAIADAEDDYILNAVAE